MNNPVLRSALVLTLLSTATTIAQANSPYEFNQAVQQYLQNNTAFKSVTKSINPDHLKFGADLSQALTQGISKGNSSSILVNKSAQLPIQVTATEGDGEQLAALLQQQGFNVQTRINDNIMLYANPNQLSKIAALDSVQTANIQGIMMSADNDNIAVNQLLGRLGVAAATNIQTTDQTTLSIGSSSIGSNNTSHQTNAQDEGVQATFAHLLHQKGLTGKGIKIGVIDFGYGHYNTMKNNGLLPNPAQMRTFSRGQESANLSTDAEFNSHGTACTEIIYKMAPKASFYLAQVGNGGQDGASDGDVAQAIDWLVSQGVNVINFSGGGHGHQHDGTAPMDQKIAEVSAQNILWVNAAGNEGEEIWSGALADQNQNGLIDIAGQQSDLLMFKNTKDGRVDVLLNWDDWPNSKQGSQNINVDAIVLGQNPATGQIVPVAEISQPRTANSAARKGARLQLPSGLYAVIMRSSQPSNKRIHVQISGNTLVMNTQLSGSIGIPATSPDALSVGAWDVSSQKMASYSSMGPTDDGRIKPDLAAPSGVLNTAFRLTDPKEPRFHGTSAAAPYTAGFAALLWQAQRNWSAAQLKDALIHKAIRPIGRSPNPSSGYGILDARRILNQNNAQNSTPNPETSSDSAPPTDQTDPNTSDDVKNLLNRLKISR